jgi:hypothetical protein
MLGGLMAVEDGGVSRHEDERGSLLAFELERAPFTVRRVFVVTGPGMPAWRGGHHTTCAEFLAVVSGSVRLRTCSPGEEIEEQLLAETSEPVLLIAGTYVEYFLETGGSTIVVLAEEAHE